MDWVERAEGDIAKEHWTPVWKADHRYHIYHTVKQGIEAVRALREENEGLKARVKAEASRVDQYKDLIRRLNEKTERLEKEKERQQQDIESYRAIVDAYQKAETQKDLRDEFAQEFMVRNGNSAQVAYRRADQMVEARK